MKKEFDTGMKDKLGEQEYRKYLESFMSAKDPNLLCELGYELYRLGELDRAEELIEDNFARVDKRKGNAVDAVLSYFSERGMSYYDGKEYKKAFIALNNFFLYLHNSKNAKRYNADPGMIRDRIVAFDRCLELCNINDDPSGFELLQRLDDPDVKNKYAAYEAYCAGSTDEGLTAYRGMAYRLGCTLLCREGRESLEKGLRYLENAADNGYPAAFTGLAEYYEKRGKRDKAQEWCENGIECLGITEELYEKMENGEFEPYISSDETIETAMDALRTLREKQRQYRSEQTGENVTSIKEELSYIHEDVRNIDRKLGVLTNIVNDGIARYEVRMNDISEELAKQCEEMIIAGNKDNTDKLEQCLEQRFNAQGELLSRITSQLKSEIESDRTDYQTYYSKLEQDIIDNVLPKAIWDSFEPKTRESIITAVMLVQMFLPVDPTQAENMNFNCAVIPATCALEIEMKKRFYTDYIEYCENKFGGIADNASSWPKELVYYNKSGIPKLNYKFALGTFLGDYTKSEEFKKFLKARYDNDDGLESRLGSFAEQLKKMNAIRIPAAHSCVKRAEAENAFEYILGIFENPAELRNDTPLMRLLGELTRKRSETTSEKTRPKRNRR